MIRKIAEGEPRPVDLPPLRPALDQWVETGGRNALLLKERWRILNCAQIPAGFLGIAYSHAQWEGGKAAIIEHEASLSASGKQAILEREALQIQEQIPGAETPVPVKTVTLAFGSGEKRRCVLVARIGEQPLTNQEKDKIAKIAEFPGSIAKRRTTNPQDITAEGLIGLPSGIVGPYLGGVQDSRLKGIAYFMPEKVSQRLVAVPATFWETLIVPEASYFHAIGNWHAQNPLTYSPPGVFLKAV